MKLSTGVVPSELGKVVDVLRDLHPEANLVLAPEVKGVLIGDVKLRAMALPDVLEALRVASANQIVWRRGEPHVDPATGIPVQRERDLYLIEPTFGPPPDQGPRRLIEVFNLGGYLKHQDSLDKADAGRNLEEIQLIIVEALKKLREGSRSELGAPSFQFHRGANLFIVTGPPDAIDVARRVISALPGQAPMVSPPASTYGRAPVAGSGDAPRTGMRAPGTPAEFLPPPIQPPRPASPASPRPPSR